MIANELMNEWWDAAGMVKRFLALLLVVAAPAVAYLLSVAQAVIAHWRHIA